MSDNANWHPSSIISASARIHPDVEVGPFCIIGDGVTIQAGCKLMSHVVIEGCTSIGEDNIFHPFTSIGLAPPDIKYKGEQSQLIIEKGNVFREGVTVHKGTKLGGGMTKIGSKNLLLPYVHIAHDCMIGDHNIFVNNTAFAGHTVCGSYTNLAGYTLVNAYCTIGDMVHTSATTIITKNVPAFIRVASNPTRPVGINLVGLKRADVSSQDMYLLKQAYKIVYQEKLSLHQAKNKLIDQGLVALSSKVEAFYMSLNASNGKGIIRGSKCISAIEPNEKKEHSI